MPGMKPTERAAEKVDVIRAKAHDRDTRRVYRRDGGLFACASVAAFSAMVASGWAAGRIESDVAAWIALGCGVAIVVGVVAYRSGLRPETYQPRV